MSKQSHTPGPWNVDFIDGVDGVFAAGDKRICQVNEVDIVGWNVRFRDESEANGRLIAAAPELLDALEDAVNRLTSSLILMKCDDDFIKKETAKARAAIAKATA
ncbi:TPA: hypothetical protein L4W78_005920 [Pseudomonas aeruginosa]|uniref:hypothetical protein n=1 Tax=Pseudomonas aeruginosa TaxID=287 RepID=UPI001C5F66AB|nr:hypothetical protein [Pseudomonas aeruginosa]QWY05842.1 hypothetical protein ICI41_20970 [Pseudomonas aeruginosa]HBO5316114.1 hypothetical protein [Pseudomonas aeruginosa]